MPYAFKALGAVAFNTTTTPLYRNQAFSPTDDNCELLLIDASGSMLKHQSEVRAAISAWQALSGTIGAFNVPVPGGGTAIVDATKWVQREYPDIKRVMLITDGIDTNSTGSYIDSVGEDGVIFKPLPCHFTEERNRAIITHMENAGIKFHLVGVGNEVKNFIQLSEKRCSTNIITGFIAKGATPLSIASVIRGVSRGGSRNAKATGFAEDLLTTDNAPVLPKNEQEDFLTEMRDTTTAEERAAHPRLPVDGPLYKPEAMMRYVNYIIQKTTEPHNAEHPGTTECVKEVIAWFHGYVKSTNDKVASALISGWLHPATGNAGPCGVLFDVPRNSTLTAAKWTGVLRTVLLRLSRDPHWLVAGVSKDKSVQMADIAAVFKKEIEEKKVGPIFVDVGKNHESHCAITEKHLPLLDLKGKIMYFKFKHGTYTHIKAFHRADTFLYKFTDCNGLTLAVCAKGNSGAHTYGGPVLGPEPSNEEDVEFEDDSQAPVVTGLKRKFDNLNEEEGEPLPEETKILAARVLSLNEENKALNEENKALNEENNELVKANTQLREKIKKIKKIAAAMASDDDDDDDDAV